MESGLITLLQNYFRTQPVRKAWLFGSVARGEGRPDSDIDILVNFDEGVGLMKYSAMVGELESILKKAVDLVSESALFPWVRPNVEKDKLLIYEREA